MYCAVLTFTTPHWPTVGTFTVSGVVDGVTGTPFQGKWFFVQGGSVFGLNAIMYQALDFFHANAQADDRGAQDLTLGGGATLAERGQGFRVLTSSDGIGYTVIDAEATTLFGGVTHQAAYISASRVGEFDYTLTINDPDGGGGGTDRAPAIYMVTVLGGDDLTVEFPTGAFVPPFLQDGTFPCAARPAALFALTAHTAAGLGGSVVNTAGGGMLGYGWEARDSGRGSAAYVLSGQFGTPSPSPNSGVVVTDRIGVTLDGSTIGSQVPVVSAWNDTSVVVTGAGASPMPYIPIVMSGDLIRAVSLDFVQDPDPISGLQMVSLGISPRWIKVASEGTPDLDVQSVTKLDHAIGWTDCAQQVGFWTGQDADGSLSPLTGARWMSTNSLLRFATANAASTVFDAVMEFVSVDSQGLLTVRWPITDGGTRRILLFALGVALPPPPPSIRLTQLPLEAAYGYRLIQPMQSTSAQTWNTPQPIPSRRGR